MIKRSVAAGFLIGMASALFVRLGMSTLAAFLFAFALFFICLLKQDLFTGKIGWALTGEQPWWYYPAILFFNCLGALLASLIVLLCARLPEGPNSMQVSANLLIDAKMALPIEAVCAKGFMCGIMMYLAVACWKRGTGVISVLGIFLCIPVFILSGFEHSIADAGYMCLALRWDFIGLLLLIAVFNGLGSIAAWWLIEGSDFRKAGKPQ